ncbi:hypothetical protein D3Y67_27235 [Escherichia coli]|nr:hypothetical protein D3Y67_27235 [Escherichia coli]
MLISTEGAIEWCAEYDEWGNLPGKDHQKFTFCTRERSSEVHFLYYIIRILCLKIEIFLIT